MSDMSMLMILIQASALIKNKSGNSSIHGYVEMQEFPPLNSEEADFKSLDCLTHILVQNTQVLAASYDDSTHVTPNNSELDDHYESQNSNSFDMELPPPEFVSSVDVNSIRSINAAVVPNPNNNNNPNDHNNWQLSGPLGQIQEIITGKNLWIEEDPLHDAAKYVDLSPHLRCLIVSTSLDVSTPEGLANHAKSVSCYLYEFGCNKTLQGKHSKSFFLYLLTASWSKLHSRFCSWHGLGFIQQLEKGITSNTLMDQIEMIGFEFGPRALP